MTNETLALQQQEVHLLHRLNVGLATGLSRQEVEGELLRVLEKVGRERLLVKIASDSEGLGLSPRYSREEEE